MARTLNHTEKLLKTLNKKISKLAEDENPDLGKYFFTRLDTNGDGTGDTNANGDYSAGQQFKITAPSDKQLLINSITVFIVDAVTIGGYGAIPSLVNGIVIKTIDPEGLVVTTLTPFPLKTIIHWKALCLGQIQTHVSLGNDTFSGRWDITSGYTRLWLKPGYSLVVECSDNFTGLDEHYFIAQGSYKLI